MTTSGGHDTTSDGIPMAGNQSVWHVMTWAMPVLGKKKVNVMRRVGAKVALFLDKFSYVISKQNIRS